MGLARYLLAAAACACCVSATATAQIRVLNPFGAPQGSVAQLTTTTSTTSYTKPPATKVFSWNGHSWSNDSGQVWNTTTPYAIGLSSSKIRFEAHDTSYDRGQIDPSTKRRSEVSSKDQYHNGVNYWMAFSFQVDWSCLA